MLALIRASFSGRSTRKPLSLVITGAHAECGHPLPASLTQGDRLAPRMDGTHLVYSERPSPTRGMMHARR